MKLYIPGYLKMVNGNFSVSSNLAIRSRKALSAKSNCYGRRAARSLRYLSQRLSCHWTMMTSSKATVCTARLPLLIDSNRRSWWVDSTISVVAAMWSIWGQTRIDENIWSSYRWWNYVLAHCAESAIQRAFPRQRSRRWIDCILDTEVRKPRIRLPDV